VPVRNEKTLDIANPSGRIATGRRSVIQSIMDKVVFTKQCS
jgi:hypothetical protein